MTTEAFAGTELARRVREAAGRDALAHAIILSGEGDLTAAARYLAPANVDAGVGQMVERYVLGQ